MVNENRLLEGVFKVVWEKTRAASELIHQLREEKRGLSQRVAELEREAERLLASASKQEMELKKLRAEHAEMMNSANDNVLSADEKERLKSKIRDLIAKINSYL
jgi:molybdenum-dependent DNA-binding transcriptional regulator ModE